MKTNSAEKVFLTVGTKKQKELCEKFVSELEDKYKLDIFIVSDDDSNVRIGSGGAVLNILGRNYSGNEKMLIVNSGGFSKRSVNYAVRGKAFANVSFCGQTVSVFELLIINAKRLFGLFESGAVVCCSDILVDTTNVDISFDNNIGFCVRADFGTGSRHGVMFCSDDNILSEYPHKCTPETLREMSRKYGRTDVLIDTGLMYLTDDVCSALRKFAAENNIINALTENRAEINLYSEIVALFAEKTDREEYLNQDSATDFQLEIRKKLFGLLSDYTMTVCALEDRKFMHFGSSAESLENITELSDNADSFVSLCSFVDESCCVSENTVLDNAVLKNGCFVGSGCIVSDITLENVKIPADKTVCGIKLCNGKYVAVVCDIDENPKLCNLWDLPRFFAGKSYTESFNKFIESADEEKYSLSYCIGNADYDYYRNRVQYMKDMSAYSVNSDYLEMRRRITESYLENRKSLTHISCRRDSAEMHFPVRVNFSGTWTDAMPYCVENGGQVINMSVLADGRKPICVRAEKIADKKIEFCSDGLVCVFSFDNADNEEDLSEFNLHIAVLKILGITCQTQCDCGFRLTTEVSGIDKGSGLGTSSILLGGCIKVLSELFGLHYDDSEVVEMVFVAEQLMKTGGGWQDQTGGLFPGMKISETQPGLRQIPCVKNIELTEKFRQFFTERLVLIPTGQRHFGRFIVNDVANRYLGRNKESAYGFSQMKKLNGKMLECLKNDDTDGFTDCINRHCEILCSISPMVTNEKISSVINGCLENVADAVSLCGAGGGGYLLAIMKKDVTKEDVQCYMTENFPSVRSCVKKADICG